MKKVSATIVVIVLVSLLVLLLSVLLKNSADTPQRQTQLRATAVVVNTPAIPSTPGIISTSTNPTAPLLGETILRGYATTASTPENDLTLMAHLMDNFSLLVKSSANLPMSVNEDWAAAFRGLNPAHERFLPGQHAALNAQGQLVDRWQTPLFFHALGHRRFEIRSAGPDKKMWTDDDLHRNADGSFRRGTKLNPPSLMDNATPHATR